MFSSQAVLFFWTSSPRACRPPGFELVPVSQAPACKMRRNTRCTAATAVLFLGLELHPCVKPRPFSNNFQPCKKCSPVRIRTTATSRVVGNAQSESGQVSLIPGVHENPGCTLAGLPLGQRRQGDAQEQLQNDVGKPGSQMPQCQCMPPIFEEGGAYPLELFASSYCTVFLLAQSNSRFA